MAASAWQATAGACNEGTQPGKAIPAGCILRPATYIPRAALDWVGGYGQADIRTTSPAAMVHSGSAGGACDGGQRVRARPARTAPTQEFRRQRRRARRRRRRSRPQLAARPARGINDRWPKGSGSIVVRLRRAAGAHGAKPPRGSAAVTTLTPAPLRPVLHAVFTLACTVGLPGRNKSSPSSFPTRGGTDDGGSEDGFSVRGDAWPADPGCSPGT